MKKSLLEAAIVGGVCLLGGMTFGLSHLVTAALVAVTVVVFHQVA